MAIGQSRVYRLLRVVTRQSRQDVRECLRITIWNKGEDKCATYANAYMISNKQVRGRPKAHALLGRTQSPQSTVRRCERKCLSTFTRTKQTNMRATPRPTYTHTSAHTHTKTRSHIGTALGHTSKEPSARGCRCACDSSCETLANRT